METKRFSVTTFSIFLIIAFFFFYKCNPSKSWLKQFRRRIIDVLADFEPNRSKRMCPQRKKCALICLRQLFLLSWRKVISGNIFSRNHFFYSFCLWFLRSQSDWGVALQWVMLRLIVYGSSANQIAAFVLEH